MRIPRLHTDHALAPDRELRLGGDAGHYVFRVLRLRAGDPLVLFNGDGSDYAAELLSNRRDQVMLRVTARLPAVPEPELRITLVQAVGKGDRMDYALQKATELGAAAIQPLFSERTEVRLDGQRLAKRQAHWRRVIIAACEQSGRARLPGLLAPATLDAWLESPDRPSSRVLDPGAETPLRAWTPDAAEIGVVVGPEGGFSEPEMKRLQLGGVKSARLGTRVLRTETAGPAAIAVLQALHGDLQ